MRVPNRQECLWPRWLRVSEVGKYASLSPKTIKKMLAEGQLCGERTPGGHWRVDRQSIDKWFSRNDEQAVAIVRSIDV